MKSWTTKELFTKQHCRRIPAVSLLVAFSRCLTRNSGDQPIKVAQIWVRSQWVKACLWPTLTLVQLSCLFCTLSQIVVVGESNHFGTKRYSFANHMWRQFFMTSHCLHLSDGVAHAICFLWPRVLALSTAHKKTDWRHRNLQEVYWMTRRTSEKSCFVSVAHTRQRRQIFFDKIWKIQTEQYFQLQSMNKKYSKELACETALGPPKNADTTPTLHFPHTPSVRAVWSHTRSCFRILGYFCPMISAQKRCTEWLTRCLTAHSKEESVSILGGKFKSTFIQET